MEKKMTKEERIKARESLRRWVVKYTGCKIQEGRDRKGWPCGTCFCSLLGEIGLNNNKEEYKEHNEVVDRVNEVWRAILQIRDAEI